MVGDLSKILSQKSWLN